MKVWLKVMMWVTKQSRLMFPARGGEVSVSCFLVGTGSGGLNRGNPTCWWGKTSQVLFRLPPCFFCSPLRRNTHIHARMHCSTLKQTYACSSVLSGWDNNWNRFSLLKTFALFLSVTFMDIHFPSFVSDHAVWSVEIYACACGGLCLYFTRKIAMHRRNKSCREEKEWLWYALNTITVVMQ